MPKTLYSLSPSSFSLSEHGGCGELSFIPVCGALHDFIIEECEAEREGNLKWPEFSLFVAPFEQN